MLIDIAKTILFFPFTALQTICRYPPFRVLFGFFFLVAIADFSVLGLYSSPLYFIGVPISLAGMIWCWNLKKKEIETGEEGWDLGVGINIYNPEKPTKQRILLQDKVLKLGFLGLGAPGSGKTVSLAVAMLKYFFVDYFQRTKEKLGGIFGDGKGDKEVFQFATAVGATFDLFFSSELPNTNTNYMNLFDGTSKDVLDTWTTILIPEGTNEYYGNKQKRALQVSIPLLKETAKALGVSCSLRDLYAVMKTERAPMEVITLARSAGVSSTIIEPADSYFKEDFEKRIEAVDGMLNKLYAFVYGEENDRINAYAPDIVLFDLVQNNQSLYLHLPYSKYARDLNFAICETLTAISRWRQNHDKERRQFPVVMDDYGGMFYPELPKATARWRASGMSVFLMFQDKGQPDEISTTFTDQLDGTVPTKIMLRTTGDMTANWASRMFGTYDSLNYSVTDKADNSFDGQNIGSTALPRVKPEEFKSLHDGEAFISTTIKKDAGKIEQIFSKVRFPLLQPPEGVNPADIDWPVCEYGDVGKGIDLWNKYIISAEKIAVSEPESAPMESRKGNESFSDEILADLDEEFDQF